MKWRPALQQLGLRLIICLIILGGGYLIVLGDNLGLRHKAVTPPQKIAQLRAVLAENYLVGTNLANFQRQDAVASASLNSLFSQYRTSYTMAEAALKTAPAELKPALRTNIQALLEREKSAISSYEAVYAVLNRVIAYEPSEDLGNLSIDKDASTLKERVTAAKNGLGKAADSSTRAAVRDVDSLRVESADNSSLLVLASTKQALLKATACFDRLGVQLDVLQQAAQATATRKECTAAYPALRLQVIRNVIGVAFPADYQKFMKTKIPDLLGQLDRLVATADSR